MTREEIIQPSNLVYQKPTLMNDTPMHYCPGCSHGMVHKLIAEVVEEMGLTDHLVFTYQGDGDLACIGTGETIHSLNRGDNIAIIFINNAIYGMTGGQMAPTTLMGMKTSTCPYGRQADLHGFPLKITEIAATLEGTCYVTRQAVHTVAAINRTKRAIRRAFQNSLEHRGTSLVEVVSTCSSGWKKTPVEANQWMEEHMFPFYPLGDLKTEDQKK